MRPLLVKTFFLFGYAGALSAPSLYAAESVNEAVGKYDALVANYNLITFKDAVIRNYGDTEGALAIGGNLKIDGGMIATQQAAGAGSPTLYVGGSVRQANDNSSKFAKQNGNLVDRNGIELKLQSGFSSLSAGALGTGVTVPNSWNNVAPGSLASWINPTSKQSDFKSISSTFASAAANGSVTVQNNTLKFTANISNGVAIFDFNASLLSGNRFNSSYFDKISFSGGVGTTFVVNVKNGSGKTLFDSSSINFTSPNEYDNLLWNIVDDRNRTDEWIKFGTGEFYGSILASTYQVYNGSNTKLNGQIVANSIDYNRCSNANELHYTPFDGGFPPPEQDLPPTPEPSTYGMIGAALCLGLAGYSRKRKQRKAA